jgi:PRC-barrel domain
MYRTLAIASALAAAITLPAFAQTTTVPQSTPPAPPTAAATPSPTALMLTADQVKLWIDKPVYSSDGKKLGEVAAFARGTDNTVNEMHADIGGFLGMGETRIRVMPAQFKLQGDRVVLNLTADQAKVLPTVAK